MTQDSQAPAQQTAGKKKNSKTNNALLALSAAAACLPSAQAKAQQIAEDFQIGLRHYSYEEDAIDPNKVLNPVSERYDIEVNQFRLVAPLSETMELNVDYQHEKMSGASPWYTFQLPGEEPKQVMSGASIEDTREDISVALKMAFDRNVLTLGTARSSEDDYKSQAFSIGYSIESQDRLTTWSFSADVSNDDIDPVDAEIFTTRPATTQSKHSNSYLASYARVMNKQWLMKLAFGMSRKSGYLDDPYKLVFVDNNLLGDSRPGKRITHTIAVQNRIFIDSMDAALHLDYRLYDDDWSIRSNTFDLAWYQNVGAGFQIVPSVRLYEQSEAFFYENFHTNLRVDGNYSTDYRLSEYGAVTYGLKITKAFKNWSLMLSGEKYESGGDTFLASADVENPGLLDFKLLSVGIDFTF